MTEAQESWEKVVEGWIRWKRKVSPIRVHIILPLPLEQIPLVNVSQRDRLGLECRIILERIYLLHRKEAIIWDQKADCSQRNWWFTWGSHRYRSSPLLESVATLQFNEWDYFTLFFHSRILPYWLFFEISYDKYTVEHIWFNFTAHKNERSSGIADRLKKLIIDNKKKRTSPWFCAAARTSSCGRPSPRDTRQCTGLRRSKIKLHNGVSLVRYAKWKGRDQRSTL